MSCDVPRNIVRQQTDKCELKCKLMYKYSNSSCVVSNRRDRISIIYDGQGNNVMFNSVPYTPIEIRIFKPSIHTYDGDYAEAEIIIVHTGGRNGLQICIPVTKSETMTTNPGSTLIEEIITNCPNPPETSTLNIPNFNANYLIPKSAYFSYQGGLLGGNSNSGFTCSSGGASLVEYVVFHQRHGSITLKSETLDTLETLIQDSFIPPYEGKSFYNEKGTTENGFDGEGQIYIDCQPTDADSELIYETPINKQKWDWLWPYFYFCCGLLICYIAKVSFMSVDWNSIGNNFTALLYADSEKCPNAKKDD